MAQICPHCGYARKATDAIPEWQCPSCEKAYSKAGSELPPPTLRQYAAAPREPAAGGLGKWWVWLLLLGAALWFGRPLWQQRAVETEKALAAGQPAVVLYATDWCGYCKATRELFESNGIDYVEHDIEKSSEALSQHRKLGGNGVPLIVVGDEVIKGYNEAALRQLLKPWFKG